MICCWRAEGFSLPFNCKLIDECLHVIDPISLKFEAETTSATYEECFVKVKRGTRNNARVEFIKRIWLSWQTTLYWKPDAARSEATGFHGLLSVPLQQQCHDVMVRGATPSRHCLCFNCVDFIRVRPSDSFCLWWLSLTRCIASFGLHVYNFFVKFSVSSLLLSSNVILSTVYMTKTESLSWSFDFLFVDIQLLLGLTTQLSSTSVQ